MALSVNVGTADRWIRLLAGLLLFLFGSLSWGGWEGTWYGVLALVVGIVLILTSLIRWCPLYALFRLRTTGKS